MDDAVDDIVTKLGERNSLVPGLVAPTVFELIGHAHQMWLRQDHVARIAAVVAGDDRRHLQLLEHATATLGWDTTDMDDWADVVSSMNTPAHQVRPIQGLAPVSLHQWTTRLAGAGLTTMPPIADAPSCSSTNVGGHASDRGATTVYGSFEIEAALPDLTYATDPRNWPRCSWFFISMTEQGEAIALPPPDAVGHTAYTTNLEELVGLEDMLTVRTLLATRYFVGEGSVGMEFDLAAGTHGDGKIDVDHGYLLAEQHPTERGKLIVRSQKTFSFVGLDDLPFSWLCEFGWIDMMRAMAQCRAPGGGRA
jgi:hypothetical protein